MKFKMNNREWYIEEVDIKTIRKEYNKDLSDNSKVNEDYFFYGLTTLSKQRVLLNKDIHIERKKQTLYHELMHVYIWNYLSNQFEYNEEQLCDISANSHDIIHKIVEDYFKEKIK
mgnify:CR=1 FL=1